MASCLPPPPTPLGTLVPPRELAAFSCWLDNRGGFLIFDEIYLGLTYDGPLTFGTETAGGQYLRGEQLLKVFLHDGIASRMDRGTGTLYAGH